MLPVYDFIYQKSDQFVQMNLIFIGHKTKSYCVHTRYLIGMSMIKSTVKPLEGCHVI